MGSLPSKTVLVVGASGLVGSASCRAFSQLNDCQVIACSRSKPQDLPDNATFFSLDLLDKQACHEAAASLKEVSHIVYCAINETAGDLISSWTDPDHAQRNGSMLENLMEPLLKVTSNLEHVTVIHGTKAYGVMLDIPLPIPLKESQARPEHDNFYFNQEDYIWAKSKNASWSWTVFRAQIIIGGGLGSNLNSLLAMAVYAALCKDANVPCGYPGNAYAAVIEMTDVDLLANAVVWSTQTLNAKDQIFNITNGDVFCWENMWPVIIDEIGAQQGPDQPASIASAIADRADQWANLVAKHQLKSPAKWYAFLGESCALSDFGLAAKRNVVTSTVKLRQAGFGESLDSEACVRKWIRHWRDQKLLPPL
jgi:nucleoside-diphosphate-sugar epimerase